ncbi:hypothetical protein BH11MYX2_BH11MYX2_06290 [soil metagenome]
MKKLAVPTIVCALLALVGMYVAGPSGSYAAIYGVIDSVRIGVLWISMVLAVIVAAASMKAPHAWQSYTALGVFALSAFKIRVWSLLGSLPTLAIGPKVLALAITGGLICTLLAVIPGSGASRSATS